MVMDDKFWCRCSRKRLQISPSTTQPTALIQIGEAILKKLQIWYAAINIQFSCLEACSREIKQRIRKLCKAYTNVVYWDRHKDNLEKFVQSICRPGADHKKVTSFSSFSKKPLVMYLGLCSTKTPLWILCIEATTLLRWIAGSYGLT